MQATYHQNRQYKQQNNDNKYGVIVNGSPQSSKVKNHIKFSDSVKNNAHNRNKSDGSYIQSNKKYRQINNYGMNIETVNSMSQISSRSISHQNSINNINISPIKQRQIENMLKLEQSLITEGQVGFSTNKQNGAQTQRNNRNINDYKEQKKKQALMTSREKELQTYNKGYLPSPCNDPTLNDAMLSNNISMKQLNIFKKKHLIKPLNLQRLKTDSKQQDSRSQSQSQFNFTTDSQHLNNTNTSFYQNIPGMHHNKESGSNLMYLSKNILKSDPQTMFQKIKEELNSKSSTAQSKRLNNKAQSNASKSTCFISFNQIIETERNRMQKKEQKIGSQTDRTIGNKSFNNRSLSEKHNMTINSQQFKDKMELLGSEDCKIKDQIEFNKNQRGYIKSQVKSVQKTVYGDLFYKMKLQNQINSEYLKAKVKTKKQQPQLPEKRGSQILDPELIKKLKGGKYTKPNDNNQDPENKFAYISQFQSENLWHPPGRIGATIIAHKKYLFLIGGRANELVENISILPLHPSKNQELRWIQVVQEDLAQENRVSRLNQMGVSKIQQMEEDSTQEQLMKYFQYINIELNNNNNNTMGIQSNPSSRPVSSEKSPKFLQKFTGRFNHTACVYQDNIIVFGGEQEFNRRNNQRQCVSEVFSLDISNLKWYQHMCRGDFIDGRRNHTACILGNHMLVFGGVNSQEKHLSSLMILDLQKYVWKLYGNQGDYQNIFDETGGLAYHTMVPIYEDIKLQKLHNSKMRSKPAFIREEGIYIFGGKFQNGKINNNLYVMKTDFFPITWKILETKGEKPEPRYSHSMSFQQNSNQMVVYGGKNEGSDIRYLNDVYALDLKELEWKRILVLNPHVNFPRAVHASCQYGSQMIVFGGMDNKKYLGGQVQIFETNQGRCFKLFERDQTFTKGSIIYSNLGNNNFIRKISDQMATIKSFLPLPSGAGSIGFKSKGGSRNQGAFQTPQVHE